MNGADRVLIVVPCLDEAAALPGLLAQLLAESGDAVIVVADGGSIDGSREIVARLAAQHPRLVPLANPARLQSAGVNAAVDRHGVGVRWLLRIDAHCDYPSDYARHLVEAAHRHRATSVVVPMVSHGTRCFQAAAAAAQNSTLGTGGSPHRHVGAGGYVDHGHHALMDLDLFRKAGGYREDMAANEDAELDRRLAAAGGRIWLEPSLALRYYPRSTPTALWRQYRSYGAGRARTLALHGGRPKLRQLLPLAVPVAVLLALLAPLWPPVALPAAAWLAACLLGGLVVGARAGGGCALASGGPAAIMHLSWGVGFLQHHLRRRERRSANREFPTARQNI